MMVRIAILVALSISDPASLQATLEALEGA